MFRCLQKEYSPYNAQTYILKYDTYQEVNLIAEGGYSYVWTVKSKIQSKQLASKRILIQSTETHEMVLKEIEILNKLPQHPNLLKIIDYGEVKTQNKLQICIITEYCENNLLKILEQNILTESQIKEYFKQIIDAVEILHFESIIHRDIKIENILIQNNICKLCDFGSATQQQIDLSKLNKRQLCEQEEIFSKTSTLCYRPPEMVDVITRQIIDTKVDIWQLGCLLYILCFRTLPFEEGNKIAIVQGIFTIPQSNISIKTITLIQNMLQVNPIKRPTIKQLKFALYMENNDEEWDDFQ